MLTTEGETKLEISIEDYRVLSKVGKTTAVDDQVSAYYDYYGVLAKNSCTFHIRYSCNKGGPMVILKTSLGTQPETRVAREIEHPAETALDHAATKHAPRSIRVGQLSYSYALPIEQLGVSKLYRVGCVKNLQKVIRVRHCGAFELDLLELPNDTLVCEVGVECDAAIRSEVVKFVKDRAPSARPSTIGNYQRLVSAQRSE